MNLPYISFAFNILLFGLLVGGLFLLNRAGKAINSYERFYQDTLKELETHLVYVQNLLKNNVLLSDDEDVKRVFKSIQSFYQIMLQYYNATQESQKTKLKVKFD